jgi:hypothetical protein
VSPESTLAWTWNLVVPVLPASFLVSPAIWRNVCPLATLNELPDRWQLGRRAPRGWLASGAIAILALGTLIPARHALLNSSGEAVAVSVIALGLLALAMGTVYAARSGFCNSLCPILPVERLYGQHPLLEVRGSRCASCTFCTPRGCIDLARDKAVPQLLGPARHSARWLLTPMGAFAASFPGLVLGYFLTADSVELSVDPFVRALLFGSASYAVAAVLALAFRIRGTVGLTLLGAISFVAYYWFAGSAIAGQLGLGAGAANAIRGAAGVLVVLWLVKARANLTRPAPRAR